MQGNKERFLVIVPAYNEEAHILDVIEDIRLGISFADILIVNDGSDDLTQTMALEKHVMVVSHPFNLGYGTALQTGFRFAEERGYDLVITMDADGQHVASSVDSLIATMNEHNADVVIGSRFLGGGYRIGFAKKAGIWLFSKIGKAYTGMRITDPTSGYQIMNRRVFSFLAQKDNYPLDYPDVNIIMALHKMSFKLVEAPVKMLKSGRKESMHSGLKPFGYVIRMFLAILLVWTERQGK